jgi:hypothetical protein
VPYAMDPVDEYAGHLVAYAISCSSLPLTYKKGSMKPSPPLTGSASACSAIRSKVKSVAKEVLDLDDEDLKITTRRAKSEFYPLTDLKIHMDMLNYVVQDAYGYVELRGSRC